jgi:RNA polymerase primary sigma factor
MMALKSAQNSKAETPEPKAADASPAPAIQEQTEEQEDFQLIDSEAAASGQECGKVLRLYMEQLAHAVPLDQEDEKKLWEQLADLFSKLRAELAFCGVSYHFAIRLLEQLDSPESLTDLFPQSLVQKQGKKALLEESRNLLGRFSDILSRLQQAFRRNSRSALNKARSEGAALMVEYPFQNELVLELTEQLRSHRLVMESGNDDDKKTLIETELFCSQKDFSEWIVRLDELLKELDTARNRLVFSYLRMVFSIAKKYQGHGVPLVDLIQEGNIGLMKSIHKFDSGLGHRFSTYAVWWIKQCVSHAVGRQSRVIRLPAHMLTALSKINKAEQQFLQENGREATPDDIAARLDMPRERVSSLKRMAMQSISLQAPVYSNTGGRDILLEDTVENMHDGDDPMRNLAKKILADKLSAILSTLPPRTRQVLTLRYGLNGVEPMSLNEMSQHFRISRERIRQIEINALTKIRNPETISLLEDYFS